MFKYLRTLNSDISAPETVMLDATSVTEDTPFCKGAICCLQGGKINYELIPGTPKYCLLEDKRYDDGKTKVRAMRLLPGMIFEVEGTSVVNTSVGALAHASYDADGCMSRFSATSEYPEADFEVLENNVNGILGLHILIKL